MPTPQPHFPLLWKAMVLLSLVWALTACDNETPQDSSENTGNTPTGNTVIQIAAGAYHNCVLLHTDQVKCWGANGSGQLGLGDTDHRSDEKDEMGNNLPRWI